MGYRKYRVQRRAREPLIQFMLAALRGSGCRILNHSEPDMAPFRIVFEAPDGERLGIVVYAFNANQRATKNRPDDEHRFQVKYGSEKKEGRQLQCIWQDPYELYTTLLVGINTEEGFFVGVDPVLHSPTRFFISIEYKQRHVEAIQDKTWHYWSRLSRDKAGREEPSEVLVGGRPDSLLTYIRFERAAKGLSQGHRGLLANKFSRMASIQKITLPFAAPIIDEEKLHSLAAEFELSSNEILDLIQSAPRLKMAVRGWVAERHLLEYLQAVPEFEDCRALEGEGQPDIAVQIQGCAPVLIECKNILRDTYADGSYKLDFQRTRASKGDPCTRYYRPEEFQIAAACLHPQTETWEYRYSLTAEMEPHDKCVGRLSNRVRVNDAWADDPVEVIQRAAHAVE